MTNLLFDPVFYRTYSRAKEDGSKESFAEVGMRAIEGLRDLGKLTRSQANTLLKFYNKKVLFPSGRWLWCGGTQWINKQSNFYGSYNCSSLTIESLEDIAQMMSLAMCGTGTGAALEPDNLKGLPRMMGTLKICSIKPTSSGVGGVKNSKISRLPTRNIKTPPHYVIVVGDSRQGWVNSILMLMTLAAQATTSTVYVDIDLSNVRGKGEKLKGFGGVANPVKLAGLFPKLANIINKCIKENQGVLRSNDVCLLLDECALVVVAGNIRRCIAYGSWVSTTKGFVPVELIKVGDLVHTTALEPKKVTAVFKQGKQPTLQIVTREFKISCTASHRIAVAQDVSTFKIEWVFAQNIREGDYVFTNMSNLIPGKPTDCLRPIRVECINVQNTPVETFDLEVEETECFFANGILVHNSAGIRQGSPYDTNFVGLKDNLWQEAKDGWSIDPEREALRMANHTSVFHTKPTLEQCVESVTKQYFSGEGAIMFAPEAIARANADILGTEEDRKLFIKNYVSVAKYHEQTAPYYMRAALPETVAELAKNRTDIKGAIQGIRSDEWEHRSKRYGLNPCGEIIGQDFLCNLSEVHLTQIPVSDTAMQNEAFYQAGLACAVLLNHSFDYPKLRRSRELDPIVGVSFTGLFDFFVAKFGVDWLLWWKSGRSRDFSGAFYYLAEEVIALNMWRKAAEDGVRDYCLEHDLKIPNRSTTVQPSGSKSLLTGSSPGWHPPKGSYYTRRITFEKNNPVAQACIEMGYSVVPGQGDFDENGKLLDNPYDQHCTEWLIEIPCKTIWADLPGAEAIDVGKFSALAQLDFFMQVQKHYTRHNTSATIELVESEIEDVAKTIHAYIENDQGYVSVAMLARFEDLQTFPRLPFEPISREEYAKQLAAVESRKVKDSFEEAYADFLHVKDLSPQSPSGCDSDKCLIGDMKPQPK